MFLLQLSQYLSIINISYISEYNFIYIVGLILKLNMIQFNFRLVSSGKECFQYNVRNVYIS